MQFTAQFRIFGSVSDQFIRKASLIIPYLYKRLATTKHVLICMIVS